MKKLLGALFWCLLAAQAWAGQNNLFSPTTGIVSGLQLTLNYNNALSALASCNSGNTAPANDQSGTGLPGQCWLDTSVSPNRVRILDSTNGTWLIVGYLDAVNHLWTPIVAGGAVNTIASASTTDLCSTQPAYVQISGTTTITSFGSTCATGTTKWAVFTGALTLTQNATSLILPNNSSNINTSVGDVIQAVALGGGNWRVIDYVPIGGLAPPPTMTLIGDVNYVMLTTDNIIATNAALSTTRTITLTAANAVTAGKTVEVCDRANGVTSSNTLTVSRAGSDALVAQGTTVTAIVLQNAGACLQLASDGVSKWLVPEMFMAPQVSLFTSGSAATYTTPVGAKYIAVTMCGGGGGGGAASTNNGSGGGTTSFGSWTAVGGNGGQNPAGINGGAGGSGGSNGTGTLLSRVSGGNGAGGLTNNGASETSIGGMGGASPFGGAGGGQSASSSAAAANSCSGGSGGGPNGGTGGSGAGGGAGEYVRFIVPAPAATYTYTVGALGSGAAAGVVAGGNGGAGRIEVTAYFQ